MGETPAYDVGFRSVDVEHEATELPVEGSIPAWLDGTLYRNGPGRFETAGGSVEHWFDGLALLRGFDLDGRKNAVMYTDRFLRSEAYRRAEAGEGGAAQFGTGAGRGLIGRVRARFLPETTDNATVNVLQVAGKLIAVTETPEMVEFDAETLETHGPFSYDDDIVGQWQCAHPVRDPVREETVNLLIDFGRPSKYQLVSRQDGAMRRELFASVPVDEPAYTHSFALTERFVVLTESPFVLNPLDLIAPWRGGEGFVDAFRWEPKRGTRFRLIDRETGAVTATCRGPSTFVFHHVNARDDGEEVVLDLVGFPDDDAVDGLYLDALREGIVPPRGTLYRIRLPIDGGAPSRRPLATGVSLPRTNERYITGSHRFTWAQCRGPDTGFADRVVKVGPDNGIRATWARPGSFCGEPVVVPALNGAAPDEGVVLVVVLDPEDECSRLVVLDAATLDVHAIATLPHVIPFDFHGQFLSANASGDVPPR
jgi:beta,beta-carotene 9',10'-dioxygenase